MKLLLWIVLPYITGADEPDCRGDKCAAEVDINSSLRRSLYEAKMNSKMKGEKNASIRAKSVSNPKFEVFEDENDTTNDNESNLSQTNNFNLTSNSLNETETLDSVHSNALLDATAAFLNTTDAFVSDADSLLDPGEAPLNITEVPPEFKDTMNTTDLSLNNDTDLFDSINLNLNDTDASLNASNDTDASPPGNHSFNLDDFKPIEVKDESNDSLAAIVQLDVDSFEFGFAILLTESVAKKLEGKDSETKYILFGIPSEYFNKVPSALRDEFMKDENAFMMEYYLEYHLVQSSDLTPKKLLSMNGEKIKTVSGAHLRVGRTSDGIPTINEAKITKASIAKNGLYYTINGTLTPYAFERTMNAALAAEAASRAPICEDDPVIETHGVTCLDLATAYDCKTTTFPLIAKKYGVELPPDTPDWARLSDVCPLTCNTCLPGFKEPPYNFERPTNICDDDPRVAAAGLGDEACNLIVSRYGCDMKITEVLSDSGKPPMPGIPAIAIVEDACRLTCDKCRPGTIKAREVRYVDHINGNRICQDDPSLAAFGVSCLFIESEYGCDAPLQLLADDFNVELPDFIPKGTRVKDACRSSCNHCPQGWVLLPVVPPVPKGEVTVKDIMLGLPYLARAVDISGADSLEMLGQLPKVTVIVPHNIALDSQPLSAVTALLAELKLPRNDKLRDKISRHSAIPGRRLLSANLDVGPTDYVTGAGQALRFGFVPYEGILLGDALEAPYPSYAYEWRATPPQEMIGGAAGEAGHTKESIAPYDGYVEVPGGYAQRARDELEEDLNIVRSSLHGKGGKARTFTMDGSTKGKSGYGPLSALREDYFGNRQVILKDGTILEDTLDPSKGLLTISGAGVLREIQASNGVVFIIDNLIVPDLFPRPPVSKILHATPGFETITKMMVQSGLMDTADTNGPITMFLSQDTGLLNPYTDDPLPTCILDALARPEGKMYQDLIGLFLVLPGIWYAEDIEDGQLLPTLSGAPMRAIRSDAWHRSDSSATDPNNPAVIALTPDWGGKLGVDGKPSLDRASVKDILHDSMSGSGLYDKTKGGYLYFEDPHNAHYPVGIVQANIKHAKGLLHIVDHLPLHVDADPRIAGFWSCVDAAFRIRSWFITYAFPMLDSGMRMPLLGIPPGRRPAWVGAGKKEYYPPPEDYPTCDRRFFA